MIYRIWKQQARGVYAVYLSLHTYDLYIYKGEKDIQVFEVAGYRGSLGNLARTLYG